MSIKHFYLKSALLLITCFATNYLLAQPRVFQSNKPSWVYKPSDLNLKQNPRDVVEGYYIKLYDYQIHAEEQTYYVHTIRDIISEAGIQNGSEIWVNFAPDYQKLTFHEVSVKRNGKDIQRLNINNIKVIATEQDAASFIYNSNYTAYLILDDIRIGDQIEYSYSLKGDNPVFKGKFFEDIYLQTSVPISQLYTSVLISEKRVLNIKEHNEAKKATRKQNKGLVYLTWEDQMIKAPKYEAYSPSWHNNYRHVQLSEYKDWDEVANWAQSINSTPATINGELLKKYNQLLAGSQGDKKLFANNAIQFVQDDIRYTGIEIGEYSHRANHPEKVFKQRYGDCKDKSLLLVTLLQQAGIEAYMALMDTRIARKMNDQLPSPSAFNHAIVYFEINDKPYWVDATVSYQGGTLDNRSFPHNGTALLLGESKNRVRSMEFNEEGDITCVETYSLLAQDSTTAKLSVQTTYTGWQADVIRSQIAYSSIQETENSYLSYYSKLYPLIDTADSLIITDDKHSNQIKVVEKYLIPEFLIQDSVAKHHVVNFYANFISDRLPSLSGKRETPIAINYPTDIDYTIRVISPYGWNINKENSFIDRDSYLFGLSAKHIGDTLLLNYQFKYHSPEISINRSAEFASDIKNITNNQLSYSVSFPSLNINNTSTYSWIAILYSLLLFLIFGFVGYKTYNIKGEPAVNENEYYIYNNVGGWLILPLIGLVLTPIRIIFDTIQTGFFKASIWDSAINPFGGSFSFKALLSFELTVNIFLICFAVLCLSLLINRKATFPQVMILYLIATFIMQFTDFALYNMLGFQNIVENHDGIVEIVRSIVSAAIWIPYMLKSTRVKGTFINR